MEEDLLPRRKRMEEHQRLLQRILDGADDPTDLPLALLKDMTDDFSEENKIGQGGFGAVYKGVLGDVIVAVKRIYVNLERIVDDDKQFGREFNSLCNTNHRNVVRFLGFCSNIHQKRIRNDVSGGITLASVRERLFCFEYIQDGSLDKHITDELRGFEWETRYEIIIGICKGLRYLHQEKNIIHMDLKPANILLHHEDGKYVVPKITDFGLSRRNEKTHTMGLCFGTRGYMAPEYLEGSKTTPACDIYSLGAIIRELVTGCMEVPNKDNVLRRWRHRWNKPPTQLRYQQVNRCIFIAERCREQQSEYRPSVSKILEFLSESESTYEQISPSLHEDDMLGIKPLKLCLPSGLKNQISCSIELINGTCNLIAFKIEMSSEKYIALPEKGTVQPKCKLGVKIQVQPRDNDNAHEFIVKSMKVSRHLRNEVITEGMFEESDKIVDKLKLKILYETTKPQEKCKIREETNMSAEEVPQVKNTTMKESPYGKGKNKVGRSKNTDASSVDTSSSTRGQCIGKAEQCNLYQLKSFSRRSPTNDKYLGKESDRAVDVARGAMGSLLDKLGKLVTGAYYMDPTIKRDIESFSVKLANIHLDLPELQNVVRAKVFVDEVRELSYNIEDMVDSFLIRAEPDSNGSGFMEIMHESVKLFENGKTTHHKIGDVIRDIKELIQVVIHTKEEYNFSVNVVANTAEKVAIYPRMSVYRNKEHLVGIEAPRDEVIGLFEEGGDLDMEKLKIVSIVGLGGLGKTTLAKAVYEEFTGYTTKAFVPVGQNPDPIAVLKKIIRDCQGREYKAEKLEHLDVGQLSDELHNFLQDKRYFIVIDDLWSCELWDTINFAFPRDKCGSKVITTTRIQEVVDRDSWSVENKVYKIKPLSDEASRCLLYRRIYGPRNDFHVTPRKKEILKYILKICGGMPLAINSIASHLARHPLESSWEHVRKSLGAIRGNDIEKMKQILDLSYIHLPDHLKTCLLHVCMYPEDREINKNDLLRQWVAEGFVSTEEGQDAEDVAEEYFKVLVDMFMIQPGKIDYYNNEVFSCRVHDIILELMRSKSSKEKFIHVIDGRKDVAVKIRRISVEQSDKNNRRILTTINKGSLEHVRSVLLYQASLVPNFLKCNYVRVLHIDVQYFAYLKNMDLTSISRLFLLRYLKIACHGLDGEIKLPEQIGVLQHLETLDMNGGKLRNYPSDIVSLPWLSYLIFRGHGRDMVLPDKIGRLKSLRILVGVCVSGSSVENIKGLGELNNLRELHIREKKIEKGDATSMRMEALHSSICKLSASLRILYLGLSLDNIYSPLCRYYWSSSIFPRVCNIRDLDLGFCSFRRCPGWIGQLHNLYKLRIVVRAVADGVSIVARLPSLAYFELYTEGVAKKEESIVISGGAFKELKELHFYCSRSSLTFEAGALPKLEKLDILLRYHMARRFLPVGIQHLPSPTLKEIYLGMDDDAFFKRFPKHWYKDILREHKRRFRVMLTRAFKPHHPAADIIIYYKHRSVGKVYDSEDDEGVDDEKDCCDEENRLYLEGVFREEDVNAISSEWFETSAQEGPEQQKTI